MFVDYPDHQWMMTGKVWRMIVRCCCRIYALIAASFLSVGLLAPEGTSAALTHRSVEQRSLLFKLKPDDGNEGDEGDEGDEVWLVVLQANNLPLCWRTCTCLFYVPAMYIHCKPSKCNDVIKEATKVKRYMLTVVSIASHTVPDATHSGHSCLHHCGAYGVI
jgi:hypothetical protein